MYSPFRCLPMRHLPSPPYPLTASGGSSYKWYRNGTAMGVTTATLSVTQSGTYSVANVSPCGETRSSNKEVIITACCHAPGVTATMQNFNPCSNAATNSTWNLTDSRADAGGQTYKVRLLADGRYWMVDDLKYPTACNKTTFSGAQATGSAGKNGISGFIGDCHNIKDSYTPAARGYLYDWMGAMQDTRLYYPSSTNPNCGTNCQGICPAGWHLPARSEFVALNNALSYTGLNNASQFNAVYGGYSSSYGSLYNQGSYAFYWSSTYYIDYYAYLLNVNSSTSLDNGNSDKHYGFSVRCLRNY